MIEFRDVSFAYEGDCPALVHASLCIAPGERVVLLGANGSGKTTLARLANGSLMSSAGEVVVDGIVSGPATARELAQLVGYVRQDPRSQIVSSLVEDEVAFGPRNLRLPRKKVSERVERALAACGISDLAGRLTTELSGGQQQLLAVAAVLAMHPRYLVLDEATSQLDGATRARLRGLVTQLVDKGVGVLELTHDAEALEGASRVVVLGEGRLVWEGTPQELYADGHALHAAGLDIDPLEGIDVPAEEPTPHTHELALDRVSVDFEDVRALTSVSLCAASELTLVLGRSGSGKTTAARVLAGVLMPDRGSAELDGEVVRAGRVGLAFQRPEDQLFCDTVLDDIAFGPRAHGMSESDAVAAAREAARELGVGEELFDRSPFSLSSGQMRKAALAGVIAAAPFAYVFDEPTSGLDAAARRDFHRLVARLVARGAAVVVITHDAREWLAQADRAVVLDCGRVVADVAVAELAASSELCAAAGIELPCEEVLHA